MLPKRKKKSHLSNWGNAERWVGSGPNRQTLQISLFFFWNAFDARLLKCLSIQIGQQKPCLQLVVVLVWFKVPSFLKGDGACISVSAERWCETGTDALCSVMTAAFALQLFCTRELLCSIWSYALYFMFFIPLNPGSFEIVITQSTREMPSIAIVSLPLCSYFHVHLCLSNLLSPPKRAANKSAFSLPC